MPRHTHLEEVLRLDPERDHLRIVYLDTYHEFPFDIHRASELALFRTFASPRISSLLDRTGEFGRRTQKRYDDTELILSEILEHGYDSVRGREALRLMNRMHHRFAIADEDFRYVMSTFIFEPIRWIERFGWRPMTRIEKLALYHYWRSMGQYMRIADVPETYEAFERFNRDYERAHFRYADTNHRVARATVDMFLSWFLPEPLRALGRPAIYALLDEPLLDAFGFPHPSQALRRLVEAALRARARVVRELPERRNPRLITRACHHSYPRGYRLEDLGAMPGHTAGEAPA